MSILGLHDDEFKSAFLDGRQALDCPEIKLIQNGECYPKVFTAPGYLMVSAENGAEARLVIKRGSNTDFDRFEGLNQFINVQSGQVIPNNHYYRLEATDLAGNIWRHPAIQLKLDSATTACVVTISCDGIETILQSAGAKEYVHFVFADDLEFPLNRVTTTKDLVQGQQRIKIKPTLSIGQITGLQITYYEHLASKGTKHVFELVALAHAGCVLPERPDDRLIEAIRFCCAKHVSPVMSEIVRGGTRTIRLSKAVPLNNGFFDEPLQSRGFEEDFYRLMSKYYDYACANANERDFAPLSAKIDGLFTLKGVALNTIALLVCVATESIVDDPLFSHLGKPDSELLGEIQKVLDSVKKAPADKDLKGRAMSVIGSMKSNRAVDKLFALANAGAIEKDDVAAWKALRNPSAHGTFEIEPEKFQELVDQVFRIVTMIYKLVFLKIGYTGHFSDYSKPGWPAGEFDAGAFIALLKPKEDT